MRVNALVWRYLNDLESVVAQVAIKGLVKVHILTIFAWTFTLSLATTGRCARHMANLKILRRRTRKRIDDDRSPTLAFCGTPDFDLSRSQYGSTAFTIRGRAVGPL